MTGHIALDPRGQHPSFGGDPRESFRTPRPADRADNQRKMVQDGHSRALTVSPPCVPATSFPFTPFAPGVPDYVKSSRSETDLRKSVVHEYIRKSIYTPEVNLSARNKARSRTSKNVYEAKKTRPSSDATISKGALEGGSAPAPTAGESPYETRSLPNKPRNEAVSARTRGRRPDAPSASDPLRRPSSANVSPLKANAADMTTLRSCILRNQRKLTELAAELERITTPYDVKEPLAQKEDAHRRQASSLRSGSDGVEKKLRFASAPATPQRSVDTGTPKTANTHDRRSEAAEAPATGGHISQPADTASQQRRAIHASELDRSLVPRSASTPATFYRPGGAIKLSLRRPEIVTSQTTPQKSTSTGTTTTRRNLQPSKGGEDLSRRLIRKEPLSAKEVRKLVMAWKAADQQLKEKMNFWVRDLPEEVRNRVRAASGIEKKFLALRDCVSLLWKAAEQRSLAVLEMQQKMADCKECYRSQQGQVESALVGVQGGLLAAFSKIEQIDQLIRMQRHLAANDKLDTRDNTSSSNNPADAQPFRPYTSLCTLAARACNADISDTDKVSTDTSSERESSAIAKTCKGGDAEEKSYNTVETNAASIPSRAAAGDTCIRRATRPIASPNTENEESAPCLAHAAPHNFTGSPPAVESFQRTAQTAGRPEAPHTAEYNTLSDQCPVAGRVSGPITNSGSKPTCFMASGNTKIHRATVKSGDAATAGDLSFRCEADRCPPAAPRAVSTQRSLIYGASPPDPVLRMKTITSPYSCDDYEVTGDKEVSDHCRNRRTSPYNVSLQWRGIVGKDQTGTRGSSLGAPVAAPSESLGVTASLQLPQGRDPDMKQEFRTDRQFSPSYLFSCVASALPSSPSPPPDDESQREELSQHKSQSRTNDSPEPQCSKPSGFYVICQRANDPYLCAFKMNDTDLQVEAVRDSKENVPVPPAERNVCSEKDILSYRYQSNGAEPAPAYVHSGSLRDQGVNDVGMENPQSNLHNEDVSWAADLVSRWRAQRR